MSSFDLIIGNVIWFWLFQSLEQTYGCRLCIGPCTTRGEVKFEPFRLMVPFRDVNFIGTFLSAF